MAQAASRFLRENAFLVAAVALPVVVAAFFLIASAVPRWTVPMPAYDLVLRVARPYDTVPSRVVVDFTVRNDRVEATLRPAPQAGYTQPWALLYVDHESMAVREIPLDLPVSLAEGEQTRTIPIEALAKVRVSAQTTAPDGYTLETRNNGSRGLVGELFGMGRYRQTPALVNRGRVVPVKLPSPYHEPYTSPVFAIGWVLDQGQR